MSYCPHCRKNILQGTFCPDCGTMLISEDHNDADYAEASSANAPEVDPCPACGALINEPGWTICRACGMPHPERHHRQQSEQASGAPADHSEAEKTSSITLQTSPADGVTMPQKGSRQAPEAPADRSEAEKTFSIALQSSLADGVITPQEKTFLMDMGKRLGLSESYLEIVMGSLSSFMKADEATKSDSPRPAMKTVIDTTAAEPKAQGASTRQTDAMNGLTQALKNRSRTPQSILDAARTLLSKGMSPRELSRHIILTLGSDIKDNSDCYVSPLFDVKKLKNATFAHPTVCNENKALFYFDDTVFGKGDEGFLLTDDTFYSSTKKMNVLSYAAMTSVRADNKKLFINDVPIDASTSAGNISAFHLMLNVLSTLWRDHEQQKEAGRSSEEKRKLKEYDVLLKNAIDSRDMSTCNYYMQKTLELSDDRDRICREIILHIGQKIKDDSSVYLTPSFNMSKLCKAPFVGRAIQADEELLLYFDSTVFGGGDEGFVLTNKALYSSNKALHHMPYYFMNVDKASDHDIILNGSKLLTVSEKQSPWLKMIFELIVRIWKDALPA